jgi:hypothetical protein
MRNRHVLQYPDSAHSPRLLDSALSLIIMTANPIPWWGWAKIAVLFVVLFGVFRSGIWPKRGDPTAWYDRAIRIIGAILIFIVFAAGAYFLMRDGR